MGWEEARVRAPQIAAGTWLNHAPLTIRGLRGRVVLIDFWDYTCVNCLRTLPYLAEWWARYQAKGLTIIGVHSPEFTFARSVDAVRQAMQDYGIRYPVVLDNAHRTWDAFANRYWPAKYLIDQHGYLRYRRFGEGRYDETEAAIQALLQEIDSSVVLPDLLPALRGEDAPGAVCYRPTPELYAGYERGDLANPEGYRADQVVTYTDPSVYPDYHFYASGAWASTSEALIAAGADATLILPYAAAQVNVVLAPTTLTPNPSPTEGRGEPEAPSSVEGKGAGGVGLISPLNPTPIPSPNKGGEPDLSSPPSFEGKGAGGLGPLRLYITQDDAPLDAAHAGEDVRLAGGQAWLEVDRPRMYNIVVNPTYERHILRLRAATPNVAVYAFTFVTCVQGETEGA